MTIPAAADLAILSTSGSQDRPHHYIDWPAIIGGIILASAISILLLTFGSAVGLSFTNFNAGEGVSPIWIGVVAASWLLWVQISSFMAGGYLTGRMRRRVGDATEHESDVRDGAHGLLVWAGALVLGAVLATSGIGAVANAVGSAASTVTQAASNVAGGAAQGATSAMDPNAYFVDTLFRAPSTDAAGAAATPAAGAATPVPAANTPAAAPAAGNSDAARAEAGRILAQGALSGDVSPEDRTYLAQLIAQNTGMTQDEAEARVTQVTASVDAAKQKTVDAAEAARRAGVLAAFLIAASTLVSAVGAYWAASMGGRHRDEGTVFADVFRRY